MGPFTNTWALVTWDATATIMSGLAAVFAAWSLGQRQIKILKRQIDIADQQTKIQNQHYALAEALRKDALFDRRFEVFQKLVKFGDDVFMNDGQQTDIETGRIVSLNATLNKAEFLFESATVAGLRLAFDDFQSLYALNLAANRQGADFKHTEHPEYPAVKGAAVKSYESVYELVASEMRLN